MPLTAIRGKTECPLRVSVSGHVGFDSHRFHQFAIEIIELSTGIHFGVQTVSRFSLIPARIPDSSLTLRGFLSAGR